MNRDSNRHTFLFAGVMVITIAFVLSFTSESLKELKVDNIKKEKMQNILSAVGVNVTRDESEDLYNQYIIEELSLTNIGEIDNTVSAFNIDLALEIKKDIIEHLWKVLISDNAVDQYESNLMRRICGLIYFSDKECAEIKLKLLNSK